MGMEVAKHGRVSRELMDRLIRQIRVIAYVSCRIREPVSVIRIRKLFDDAVKDIVNIAAEGDRPSADQTGSPSCPFSAILQTVRNELIAQRERHHKRERCNGRPHDIVAHTDTYAGGLDQPCGNILTTVIIIDTLPGEPHVLKRHVERPCHGCHKSVVHELLCAVGFRLKADDIDPDSKDNKEHGLLDCDEFKIHSPEYLAHIQFEKGKNVQGNQKTCDNQAVPLNE